MASGVFRLSVLIAVTAAWASFAEPAYSNHSAGRAHERRPIFDIGTVATSAPDSLLGIEVVADDVRVSQVTKAGFWVTPIQGEARIFIVPAEGSLITVRAGEMVSVHGEVRLPSNLVHRDETSVPYVYAYTVRPAWPSGTIFIRRGGGVHGSV